MEPAKENGNNMMTKLLKLTGLLAVVAVIIIVVGYFTLPPDYESLAFPGGKSFAFTICDDTDLSTVDNVKPMYDLLHQLGLRTTKTVWVLPTNDTTNWANRGETLSDSAYAAFVLELKAKGFEIGYHGSRGGNSRRDETIQALSQFRDLLGEYPRVYVNHSMNAENLYWGADKLSIWPIRTLYELYMDDEDFFGNDPESEYFWGDIAAEHLDYVVSFSFFETNMAKVNPYMPYHDPEKPYVKYWFHTAEGRDMEAFNELLSPTNLDRLEQEGGVCIVYTHLAYGFVKDGMVDSVTQVRLRDLASRNGWFVPTSEILDYLRSQPPDGEKLPYRQRLYLELRWMWEKLWHGSS